MSKAAGRTSKDDFSRVVDLLVEYGIKLDAMEHVLKVTNHLVHELYLGAIEDLQAHKAAELKRYLLEGST